MKKINKNFLVISNYNNDLSWIPEYTDNYLVYNKRNDMVPIPNTIDSKKILPGSICGYNSYEYFKYIIENYENLPECVIFAKGWTFPRHIRKERFDKIMNNDYFTPIEDWETYETNFPVSFISSDGGLCEINDSWYFKRLKYKYFNNYNDFLRFIYKNPVLPLYIRFSPGGDCIVPRENILKIPKIVYQNLMLFMSHCREPAETHMIERTIFTLWTSNFEFSSEILKPLDESFRHLNKRPEKISRKIYYTFCKIIVNLTYKMIHARILRIIKKRKKLFKE